ncbi:MAG: hypothetical protein HGA71_09810 [Azonexaceae bacterium]|nr:hypothetical protein [Azonexaceae bacterium]
MQQRELEEKEAFVRYVAAVDSSCANPDGSIPENAELILDAIPADLLDRFADQLNRIREQGLGDDEEIGFLLLNLGVDNSRRYGQIEAGNYLQITVTRSPQEGDSWFEARSVGVGREDNEGFPLYVRLDDAAPNERAVKTLKAIAEFSHVPDMKKDSDTFSLDDDTSLSVAVYDVGQASFNALVNEFEHPVLFFDFGWPAKFNAFSRPQTSSDFNPLSPETSSDLLPAPVVLSHLDWDHWAYAYLSGQAKWDKAIGAWKTEPKYRSEALMRPWLMRRPQFTRHNLGPSHIHFVDALSKITLPSGAKALHFWPKRTRVLNLGSGKVFCCRPIKGAPKSAAFLRNNQGLGLLVSDKTSGARVLFPGDADYPSIPLFAKQQLTGLVAAHHGGKVSVGSVPNATSHGRMVLSVFPGSYSNIPHSDVEDEAYIKGWRIAKTSDRIPCFRFAPSGKKIQCGNRLIRLSETPECTCNGVPNGCLCISKL